MMKISISALMIFALSININGQSVDDQLHTEAINSISTFRELLAIPNDANDLDDIIKNVEWCEQRLQSLTWKTQRIATETRPQLYAEYPDNRENIETVLFYFHMDGQTVDPQFWYQDDPYHAVLKKSVEGEGWVDIPWSSINLDSYDPDWYMFARSASDSKNNLVMMLTAMEVMLKAGKRLPYRLKIILDFEEEKGSPSLAASVTANKELLAADMLVIFDGPRHISNEPTLAFGARGIATMSLTVYGPVFAQHSGHYGNFAPNPALRLSQLLASMKDDQGRVTIPGYYDGISFDPATEAILDAVPDDERVIRAKLGIANNDQVADSYQKSLQYPSLNIRGLSSGWTGSEARTIIPATATAEIDMRLVKESDPDKTVALVLQHIKDQGYHIIDRKPTQKERITYPKICRVSTRAPYKAFRTEFDTPIGLWLTRAMTEAFGKTPVRTRTMGGSIPISPFIETLNVPAVVVPMANKDNNQHSPNENIRLGNYIDGVKAMYYILTTPIN